MGKNKKRSRTRALFEAAAAAAAKRKREEAGAVGSDESLSAKPLEIPSERRNGKSTITTTTTTTTTTKEDHTTHSASGKPSAADLAVALRTIRYLASVPDEFSHSRDYKELRAALHPLVTDRLRFYDKGVDYRARVTLHLSHQRWAPAISALAAAKDFGQVPKQGTVQRWVRDVDGCPEPAVKIRLLASILGFRSHGHGGASNESSQKSKENGNENDNDTNSDNDKDLTNGDSVSRTNKHDPALALIEAQAQWKAMQQENSDANRDDGNSTEVRILEGWKIPASSSSSSPPAGTDDDASAEQPLTDLPSRIVYREKASERTPPNHYDLLLHATTRPASVLPLPAPTVRVCVRVRKHPVPFVKDAFVLEGVLHPTECRRLVEAASLLGYRPDHPTALPKPTGIDSCEWLVEDAVHTLVYDRVRDHLPASMGGKSGNDNKDEDKDKTTGAKLCGINRRWRFFRYGQGCVYRPHIDGSWPAGYLSKDGKSYERDETGTTRSYLTFLIYLNEDFEGGETRFYFPSSNDNGNDNDDANANATGHSSSLVARGVIPSMGSVLVFPQGNTASLLHEGSAVTRGTKKVVRTDVVYKHGS